MRNALGGMVVTVEVGPLTLGVGPGQADPGFPELQSFTEVPIAPYLHEANGYAGVHGCELRLVGATVSGR